MFVVNHCTVTPVRQEPSEGSEQLTQLLFSEVCEVLDCLPRWTKIRSTVDGQEGWVDFKILNKKHVWVGRAIPTLRMLYLCLLSGWRRAFQRMA